MIIILSFCRENRAHMLGIFEDRLVALNAPINYPPRSPDLTVMDIWVFAYIKGLSLLSSITKATFHMLLENHQNV